MHSTLSTVILDLTVNSLFTLKFWDQNCFDAFTLYIYVYWHLKSDLQNWFLKIQEREINATNAETGSLPKRSLLQQHHTVILRNMLLMTHLQKSYTSVHLGGFFRKESTWIPRATVNYQNKRKDAIKWCSKLLLCTMKACDLRQKGCVSSLTNWQPSRELTSWAFWQERMEPAKFSITHTAESSMKKVIWKRTKEKIDYSPGQAPRKKDLAVNKNLFHWTCATCFQGKSCFSTVWTLFP